MTDAYAATVVADAPFHYWRPSAYPYGGLLVPPLGSAGVALIFSVGTVFEGWSGVSDDGVSVFGPVGWRLQTDGNTTLNTPLTLEAWVFKRRIDIAASGIVVAWDGDNANTPSIVYQSDGKVRFSCHGIDATSPSVLTSYQWHHLVGVADGAHNILYVDGASVASVVASGLPAAQTRALSIAYTPASGVAYAGWIAEPAAYLTALSAGRVAAHFNAASLRSTWPGSPLGGAGTGGTGIVVPPNQFASISGSFIREFKNTP
jgi:hypothetical protein